MRDGSQCFDSSVLFWPLLQHLPTAQNHSLDSAVKGRKIVVQQEGNTMGPVWCITSLPGGCLTPHLASTIVDPDRNITLSAASDLKKKRTTGIIMSQPNVAVKALKWWVYRQLKKNKNIYRTVHGQTQTDNGSSSPNHLRQTIHARLLRSAVQLNCSQESCTWKPGPCTQNQKVFESMKLNPKV